MKSSLNSTTAAAFRGFVGLFADRTNGSETEAEHIPFVVSACGYHAEDAGRSGEPAQFESRPEGWHPGLIVDNFS
ncbi:MAG: hypothetical protein QM780_11340 [Hyphomicrobium sp.]|uniref:hypothetical protein n=1 Tax=Hyphomicrobium sp. TaxID=82 RepID=UPI0039E4E3F4